MDPVADIGHRTRAARRWHWLLAWTQLIARLETGHDAFHPNILKYAETREPVNRHWRLAVSIFFDGIWDITSY